jgi:hypothetical protein
LTNHTSNQITLDEIERIPIQHPPMPRKKLTPNAYDAMLAANGRVCCVCKRRGIGVNIHHIDEDPANNNPANLAVLCVLDHDAQHRPAANPAMAHLDLSADEIHRNKIEWEAFVQEASKPNPAVLATVNVYGSADRVHSARLLFQWADGRVVFERVYHLLDGAPDTWIDSLFGEIVWLGKGIKLALIDGMLDVDYCPHCGGSLSNVIRPGVAKMLTAPDWPRESVCSIYINPERPSLAVHIAYRTDPIVSASLHKCGRDLHLHTDNFDERKPIARRPGVRSQATSLVMRFLSEWNPGTTLIGTGDPNRPELIDELRLPR